MTDRIAQLESTSAILGEYMLRGWALTDLSCDTCSVTPLMREPSAIATRENRPPVQFCAFCDGRPDQPAPRTSQQPTLNPPQSGSSTSIQTVSSPFGPIPLPTSSSPTVTYPDPSEQISTLLLQGYSLLGDNCPNETCRGIPLVGYPKKKDGSKDGRRICVVCNGAWVDESDLGNLLPLAVPTIAPTAPFAPTGSVMQKGGISASGEKRSSNQEPESPRSRARRELYETGQRIVEQQAEQAGQSQPIPSTLLDGSRSKGKGRDLATEQVDMELDNVELGPVPSVLPRSALNGEGIDPTLEASLAKTANALSATLDNLSESLERHSSQALGMDQSRFFVDIKLHTEAIKDVLGVVEVINRIKRS